MRTLIVSSAMALFTLSLASTSVLAQTAPTAAEDTPAKAPARAAKSLKVGDKPPALEVKEWIKGEPVTGFEKGRIYVVEFWATWCPPCERSIPKLTALQKKHKDKVSVIGVSVWEEDQADVKPYVEKKGDVMDYHIALDLVPKDKDGNSGAMALNWLKAAGQDGIPSAFVIDREGTIVWIGNPLSGLEKVVDQVVAGTFDAKALAEQAEKLKKVQTDLRRAMGAQDFDKVLPLLDEMARLEPDSASQMAATKFMILAKAKNDMKAAYAEIEKDMAGPLKEDAEALNQISWTILDEEEIAERNIDLAMRMAVRAVEVSKGERADILDTLARAHYEKGDIAKAIEWQKKAIAKSPEEMKEDLEATLKKYEGQAGKPKGE
ncbi:MAG: redoxin family protein [Phycisphaerales bacterium]